MNNAKSRRRRGFTLVELMTVIAIIVLLIGVLIPALSAVRRQAKNAATAGLIKSLGAGCELFHSEFKSYPQSRGENPFEGDSNILLMGFQWLGLQLVGPDSRGIVNWKDVRNDTNDDGVIDSEDWLNWYDLNAEYDRLGPYASVDGKSIQSLVTYRNTKPDIMAWPVELEDGSSDWPNSRIPFFIDAFGNPVLYYKATPKVKAPFTTGTPGSDFVVGHYDQSDNAYITGSPGTDGRYADVTGQVDGWDLAGAGYTTPYAHNLGDFQYEEDQVTFPDPKTFGEFFCDGNIFDNTVNSSGEGQLAPVQPDSYVLISAGDDATYGTQDDITNFQRAQ